METLNISGERGALNKNAKSAALSTFELQAALLQPHAHRHEGPSLIKAIEADIARGDAVIVQLVSTGEALLERRLAEVPTGEWQDLNVDITPREYADYLANAFPTQLFEVYADEDGNECSRPMFDGEGNPVINRAAEAKRDAMIEHLRLFAADRARSDIAPLRRRRRGRGDGPQTSFDEDGVVKVRNVPAYNLSDACFHGHKKRILIFWTPAAPGGPTMPIKTPKRPPPSALPFGAAGGPTTPFRGLAAPTAPITPVRRCSARSRPTSRAKSGFRPSPEGWTPSAPSPRASARPEDTACSAPKTTLKAPAPTPPCASFTGNRAARSTIARRELPGTNRPKPARWRRTAAPGTATMSKFLNRVLALTIARQNSLFAAFETVLEQMLEGMRAGGGLDGVETLQAHSFTRRKRAMRSPMAAPEPKPAV